MPERNRKQAIAYESDRNNHSATESSDERTPEQRREDKKKASKPPVWEWIVAFIGLVLIAGAVGFMLYRAIAGNSSPPNITVNVDSILATSNGYLVTFRVFNRGELTAAGLTVEGELKSGAERVETTSATIGYVPSRSERRGGLYFIRDPQQFELQLRAKGYERP